MSFQTTRYVVRSGSRPPTRVYVKPVSRTYTSVREISSRGKVTSYTVRKY